MLKNKLLCGIACFAIGFVSAMDNTKKLFGPSALSFKQVKKIDPALFNNEEEEKDKKVAAPHVTLIDEYGRIPVETLGKMPIKSSALLSKYHPKALDNCHNYTDKNEILAIVKIIHGAPKVWQGLLWEQLGLKSKKSQEKVELFSVEKVFESYAMALRLHNGVLKDYSVDDLFGKLSHNDLRLSDGLSEYFAQGHSKIKVDISGYKRIEKLPKEVREKFHNKEEFLQVELMPSLSDQAIHVVMHGIMGGVLGSGVGGITGFGLSSAGKTVVGPAIIKFAKEGAAKVLTSVLLGVFFGVAHRSGTNSVIKAAAMVLNNENSTIDCISDIVTTTPQAYVEGFTNNQFINENLIKDQCEFGNFVPKVWQEALHGDTHLSSVGFNKACGKAISAAQSFSLVGVFFGVLNGLSTVKKSIVKKNISQL